MSGDTGTCFGTKNLRLVELLEVRLLTGTVSGPTPEAAKKNLITVVMGKIFFSHIPNLCLISNKSVLLLV